MERLGETTLWLVDVNCHCLGLDFINHRRAALAIPLPPIERPGLAFICVGTGAGVAAVEVDEEPKRKRGGGWTRGEAAVVVKECVCQDCGKAFTYDLPGGGGHVRQYCEPCKRERVRVSNCKTAAKRRLRMKREGVKP